LADSDITLDVIGVDFDEGSERARVKSDVKKKNEKLLASMAEEVGGTLYTGTVVRLRSLCLYINI
jgi:hypothetical protein